MPSDHSACCSDAESVLGEEDPGAAMDVFYRSQELAMPLPVAALLDIEKSEGPIVAGTERAGRAS